MQGKKLPACLFIQTLVIIKRTKTDIVISGSGRKPLSLRFCLYRAGSTIIPRRVFLCKKIPGQM
jgi:hypothetical protein